MLSSHTIIFQRHISTILWSVGAIQQLVDRSITDVAQHRKFKMQNLTVEGNPVHITFNRFVLINNFFWIGERKVISQIYLESCTARKPAKWPNLLLSVMLHCIKLFAQHFCFTPLKLYQNINIQYVSISNMSAYWPITSSYAFHL